MDQMNELRRTCYCTETCGKMGETVVVGGFAQKVRNLGNLIFIDLRDITGIVQLAFNDQTGQFSKRLPPATASMCCWQRARLQSVPA